MGMGTLKAQKVLLKAVLFSVFRVFRGPAFFFFLIRDEEKNLGPLTRSILYVCP